VGAGAAVLAASFEAVSGTAVPAAQLAAFFVGMSTLLTLVGATLGLAICLRAAPLRTLAGALRTARGEAPARAQA
jgi:hypothetical protein